MATKKLTDEEKAAKAAAKAETEKAKAAQEADKDAEIAALKEQLAELMKRMDDARKPQIVTISADTERVQLLWQAEVADDNITSFGDGGAYGRIIGKTGVVYVPKSDLSRVLTPLNRYYLDRRELLIVSGLADDEREALGVAYKEGELLDKNAFAKMVELEDKILEIYPNLCDGHKEMVAKRYNEAFAAGNIHVKRDVVAALHKLAKDAGRGDDFKEIMKALNAAEE